MWHLAFLGLILLLAVLIRFDEIQAPGHLLDREYTSAIFARAYYFENNPNIEPWRQELAEKIKNRQPVLEPPVTDLLVSWIYRIMGKEEVWYSRFLTNAFWLIGAIFFYLLTRTLLPRDPSLIATGFYLFNPMGIEISRSFQPDALMMLTFLASLYLIARYFEHRTWKWLILTGSVAGFTLLHRPLVLFTLMAFFYGMAIYTNRNAKEPWRRMIDSRFILFNLLALFPTVVYYGYGIFVASYMKWKIANSFKPFLLTNPEFWQGGLISPHL
jgi:4-amino-4-deoxy-L-arabinose transferase-like glycosyltransferase